MEFFHKSEVLSDQKLEETIVKLLEMECPITAKSRIIMEKKGKKPKKIKDTHILVLVPEKLSLNSLEKLI